jgi:Tol biopolymer transport system component
MKISSRIALTIGSLFAAIASLLIFGQPVSAAALPLPTGSHIVFQTSSGGAIYIVNPDGSGLRYLTTGMDPALSPDGRQVAFTRWDGGSGDGALGSVWVINIDGTGERKVEGAVRQPKSPTWSPDGTQLVVQMQQDGTLQDTYTCVVNGKSKSGLTQPIAKELFDKLPAIRPRPPTRPL